MELSGVSHGEVLPSAVTERVPHREKIVLAFVLAFLEARSIPAQLLVNGGYVRDLLLGKTPDDLDLSLCLRDCAPDVTIDSVMGGLSHFAAAHSEHCVTAVKVSTILSDASKDKNVDTAKALVTVGGGVGRPERVEVDFMPTIGEETYDESDRVPLRDVRGTPEQDALRRDLTIGAMLLHVTQPSPGATGAAAADALQWRLLDYYGGLADLRTGVLRSPFPRGRALTDVWAEVLRSSAEQQMAASVGLALPVATVAGAPTPLDGPSEAAVLQVIWWVKVLRDDPLRVLRAMRFSAKLRFELHDAFWFAVPFALASLQAKVAGSRKATELLKIAKAGRRPLLDFLALSFGRPLPIAADVLAASPAAAVLAPALFGGADPKGTARFLTVADGFDEPRLRTTASALPVQMMSDDESLGSALAAAVYACELGASAQGDRGAGIGGGGTGVSRLPADADAAAAAAAAAAQGMRRATGCVRRMSCASPPRCRCTAFESCSRRRTRRDRTTCSRRRAVARRPPSTALNSRRLSRCGTCSRSTRSCKAAARPATTAISSLRSHARAATRRPPHVSTAVSHSCARRGRPSPAKASSACLDCRRTCGARHSRSSTCSAGCAPPPARPSPPPCRGRPNSWPSWTTAAAAFSSSCTPSGTRATLSRRRTRRSAASRAAVTCNK